LLYPIFR
jgi:hypothetical protein